MLIAVCHKCGKEFEVRPKGLHKYHTCMDCQHERRLEYMRVMQKRITALPKAPKPEIAREHIVIPNDYASGCMDLLIAVYHQAVIDAEQSRCERVKNEAQVWLEYEFVKWAEMVGVNPEYLRRKNHAQQIPR